MKPTPLKQLAQLIDKIPTRDVLVTGAAIDSRLVQKGDLFFALAGNRSDGHNFLEQVAKSGAAAACVEENYEGQAFGLPLLFVPDVAEALQQIAAKTLQLRKTKVVAITGSMGKTTTKEFTAALLSTTYRLTKSPFSYNSKVTLPLSILKGEDDDEIIVLEMGMSEKGEIAKLVSIAPPYIACLTTVTYQHSTGFPEGLRGIAEEKGSIFSHPQTSLGLVWNEIPHLDEIKKIGTCPKKTFSLECCECSQEGILIEGHLIKVNLPMKEHMQNFLAAVTIARALNVPWEAIQKASPTLTLPPMRFEKLEKSGILFINDAYNANPEATMAALKNLPEPKASCKTIAVLSEMNALGKFTEEGHTNVAFAALPVVDLLLCLGKNCLTMKKIWESEKKPVHYFEKKDELASALKKLANPGDVVLLKGARAWALEELLNHF